MYTVPDLFSSTVEKHSDRIAVVEEGRSITYMTLDLMVRSFASYLVSRGIGHGDKVAILLPNSIEFIMSFYSVASIGAISVPIDTTYKEEEIKFYISHSSARLVLTEEKLKPLVEKAAPGTNASIVVIRGDKTDWIFSEDDTEKYIKASIKPSDEVIYLYSTGSTGKPKCVPRSHFYYTFLMDTYTQTLGLTEKDRVLITLPLSHGSGLGHMRRVLKTGASIYVLSEFNRNKVIDLIEREALTVFPAVPFMLDMLAETFLPKPRDFSSLRLVVSTGAPLSEETFYKFYKKFGIYPIQLYGSTETGTISLNLNEDMENRSGSVGFPVKNVEAKIFREDGMEASVNEVGEIAVKSPSMAAGYYGLPEETEKAFREGYYFTGDLGRIDEKGYIYIVGRKKLLINVAGNKVDPIEVESFLLTHPKIREAVVFSVKDSYGNESVKAVIVPKENMSTKEVYDYCRGRISDLKIPRIVEFRSEIPKSPTGKALREYLK